MLTDDDVLALDRRAREVGRRIGWDLQFVVAGNPEFVGLVASGGADQTEQIVALGPSHTLASSGMVCWLCTDRPDVASVEGAEEDTRVAEKSRRRNVIHTGSDTTVGDAGTRAVDESRRDRGLFDLRVVLALQGGIQRYGEGVVTRAREQSMVSGRLVDIQFELEAVGICGSVGIGCGVPVLVADQCQRCVGDIGVDLVRARSDRTLRVVLFRVAVLSVPARCQASK